MRYLWEGLGKMGAGAFPMPPAYVFDEGEGARPVPEEPTLPAGHPERATPHVPPSPAERRIWADLNDLGH
ncbi:DUF6059 family protein [Actinoallomurus sp. NPDC052274]|uniref:DUF6059 family protein n=1 Tax=Actinoallomurus sp. NPDC052274 TaxID=3155420 RepID=UPI003413C4F9